MWQDGYRGVEGHKGEKFKVMRQSEKKHKKNQTLFENVIMKPNSVYATQKLKLGKLFK